MNCYARAFYGIEMTAKLFDLSLCFKTRRTTLCNQVDQVLTDCWGAANAHQSFTLSMPVGLDV
jgi:hypothetical protein